MSDDDKRRALAELRSHLRLVFTSDAAVEEWLDAPDPSLGGLSPRLVAHRPDGLERVRDLVARMIHGIP